MLLPTGLTDAASAIKMSEREITLLRNKKGYDVTIIDFYGEIQSIRRGNRNTAAFLLAVPKNFKVTEEKIIELSTAIINKIDMCFDHKGDSYDNKMRDLYNTISINMGTGEEIIIGLEAGIYSLKGIENVIKPITAHLLLLSYAKN